MQLAFATLVDRASPYRAQRLEIVKEDQDFKTTYAFSEVEVEVLFVMSSISDAKEAGSAKLISISGTIASSLCHVRYSLADAWIFR